MRDDERVEQVVRSSILKLLRENEFSRRESSVGSADETARRRAMDEVWVLHSKARGSPMAFKA